MDLVSYRQDTDSEERFRFLSKHLGIWFFTETARKVAKEELKKRLREMPYWA